jgi:signal transduction histidine kinase/ActR/RegA family two-component response regulator/HAMP domain-containing protein
LSVQKLQGTIPEGLVIHRLFASLRYRLILLVLIALVPALCLTAYTGLQVRDRAGETARANVLRIVRIASADHAQTLDGARVLLTALARLPEVRRRDAAACSALSADLQQQYPRFANLGAIAPNGDVFCSAIPFSRPTSVADRPWFRRALATRTFAIGEYQIGRITGKPSLNAGYPVIDGGEVKAVVFVALDLGSFNHLVANAQLAEGSSLTMIDQKGTILAHYPDAEKWVGRSVPDVPIVKVMLSNQDEGTAEVTGVDGVKRLFAFMSLGRSSQAGRAYVAVGIPTSVAFAEVDQLMTRQLGGLLLLAIVVLATAWLVSDAFVLRKVRALVSATSRLRAGDLTARSGLPHSNGELSQLAGAFDEMAEALQTRAERLDILHQIDQAILTAQSPEAIAEAALREMRHLIPYRRATVSLFDFAAGETIVLMTQAIGDNPMSPGMRLPMQAVGDLHHTIEVLRQGKVHVLDLRTLSASSPVIHALQAGDTPLMNLVPLIAQGELIGSLNLGLGDTQLTSEQADIAREVADQLAVALQQAQLREELREHAADLERRVTERSEDLEQARREADRANQAKSEFLSRMSHELRTPLNAILGFAQLLEMDLLNQEQRESVGHILKGGRHLLDLINEVLDISRIETGRLAISLEPVSVREVVIESLDLIAPLAAKQKIRLESGTRDVPDRFVLADRQRLKQVLLNLLSNAVKYNRPQGTVALSFEEAAGRLRITVRDTGPGIAPERMNRLFTPFDRLGVEQAGIEGTGLGLALSMRLVDAMGGTMAAESAVGVGSRFWMELPTTEGPEHRVERMGDAPAAAELEASKRARLVLYVEDNIPNLKLIQRLLAHRPEVRLLPAMQGRLGLDLARQHRPDLILLDLHLPDIQGDEILNRLQDDPETRHIPVVVISADATPGQVERLLAAGARDYLTKPLNVQKLLSVLDDLLQPAELQNT